MYHLSSSITSEMKNIVKIVIMNKTFLLVLVCAAFATYVNGLPLNAIKEPKAAFVSDMEDDLEPAETRNHFKKNQVYAQPQSVPVYAQAQPVAVYSQPQHVPVYSQQQPVAVYSQHQPAAVYSQHQPAAVYSQPQPVAVYSQQQPVASHTVYTGAAPAHSGGGYGENVGYGGQSYGHSWGGSYGGGNQYSGGFKSKLGLVKHLLS